MSKFYKELSADYQEKTYNKWKTLLEDTSDPIEDKQVAMATALVLENTEQSEMNEAYSGPAQMSQYGSTQASTGGALGTTPNSGYGDGADARMPSVVVPMARRIFPNLLAHQVCGVQPMQGPVGFAFALRAQYGVNGKGGTNGAPQGTEIGYNSVDSSFTGASGNAGTGSFWDAFAGTGASANGVNSFGADGQAENLNDSEWWNIGEDMPMAQLKLEKGTVTAKTRKLAAGFSLELAEDMMAMQGINVSDEFTNIISYEISQEIDRQLLGEMVKASITGNKTSTWSPVSADGRNQLERIGTLYTHMLQKSNEIAITSRRGPANFAIASPQVTALLERLGDFALDSASMAVDTNPGIAKVGVMRNGSINLFRDTFAGGDYILLGYKGPTPYDAGIVYCPYIPIQLMHATGQENFTPRMGVRTRYGIMNHLFGAENYYQFIKVEGINQELLSGDGGRVFQY